MRRWAFIVGATYDDGDYGGDKADDAAVVPAERTPVALLSAVRMNGGVLEVRIAVTSVVGA